MSERWEYKVIDVTPQMAGRPSRANHAAIPTAGNPAMATNTGARPSISTACRR